MQYIILIIIILLLLPLLFNLLTHILAFLFSNVLPWVIAIAVVCGLLILFYKWFTQSYLVERELDRFLKKTEKKLENELSELRQGKSEFQQKLISYYIYKKGLTDSEYADYLEKCIEDNNYIDRAYEEFQLEIDDANEFAPLWETHHDLDYFPSLSESEYYELEDIVANKILPPVEAQPKFRYSYMEYIIPLMQYLDNPKKIGDKNCSSLLITQVLLFAEEKLYWVEFETNTLLPKEFRITKSEIINYTQIERIIIDNDRLKISVPSGEKIFELSNEEELQTARALRSKLDERFE
ncbi:hypothetical protein [Streptococcus sp.]|nr:hypothetical protein [Streptococcus sp.]MDY3823846.1 hypothetical protein [Streptococcus sp.]